MNLKVATITLSILLLVSVALNVIQGRAQLKAFDDIYGDLAKQFLLDSKVLGHINNDQLPQARALLEAEVKNKGTLIYICIEENCSEQAKNIMAGKNAH